ncbi:GNAT family N-acetyltransferase [Streptomyces sp. SKN60]|uniref:GNAT family N-acetyltransferase n=1 Tax=Streptomyces sp. SKN60 TaxID=2855506 RepID=UPI0022469FF9|nr:N-acetyltransferase [Streptomyces sp. SKN60]MCX2183487.1 GNAT family N-acetyltransferase [Streptomyces sp. SKN60]
MDFTIRPVRPEEYEALGELTGRAYLDDGFLLHGADDWYYGHLRNVAGRAELAEVLAAVDADGTVLGGVTFVPAPGVMGDRARPGETEIRMLAVDRAARGRGVGEALVRACVERARTVLGCWGSPRRRQGAIVLSTQPEMRTAHRIYERLGFRRVPERDWAPIPEKPDFLLLCYALEL